MRRRSKWPSHICNTEWSSDHVQAPDFDLFAQKVGGSYGPPQPFTTLLIAPCSSPHPAHYRGTYIDRVDQGRPRRKVGWAYRIFIPLEYMLVAAYTCVIITFLTVYMLLYCRRGTLRIMTRLTLRELLLCSLRANNRTLA